MTTFENETGNTPKNHFPIAEDPDTDAGSLRSCFSIVSVCKSAVPDMEADTVSVSSTETSQITSSEISQLKFQVFQSDFIARKQQEQLGEYYTLLEENEKLRLNIQRTEVAKQKLGREHDLLQRGIGTSPEEGNVNETAVDEWIEQILTLKMQLAQAQSEIDFRDLALKQIASECKMLQSQIDESSRSKQYQHRRVGHFCLKDMIQSISSRFLEVHANE